MKETPTLTSLSAFAHWCLKKKKSTGHFSFFHLFVETKSMNIQAATVYFILAVSVLRLLVKHLIRYVAKNIVGQGRSNAIMQ